MTAARVVSLPVLAMASTQINNGSFFHIFKIPYIFDSGFLGRASLAPTALAQSMLDPPPKPIKA